MILDSIPTADQSDPAEWPAWTDRDRWVPSEPFTPSAADQAAATTMFADGDYDLWLDTLHGAPPLDPIAAEIAYDEELEQEFEWARRRRAANQPTETELAMVATHGTV
jgi:hypothetical protein